MLLGRELGEYERRSLGVTSEHAVDVDVEADDVAVVNKLGTTVLHAYGEIVNLSQEGIVAGIMDTQTHLLTGIVVERYAVAHPLTSLQRVSLTHQDEVSGVGAAF